MKSVVRFVPSRIYAAIDQNSWRHFAENTLITKRENDTIIEYMLQYEDRFP